MKSMALKNVLSDKNVKIDLFPHILIQNIIISLNNFYLSCSDTRPRATRRVWASCGACSVCDWSDLIWCTFTFLSVCLSVGLSVGLGDVQYVKLTSPASCCSSLSGSSKGLGLLLQSASAAAGIWTCSLTIHLRHVNTLLKGIFQVFWSELYEQFTKHISNTNKNQYFNHLSDRKPQFYKTNIAFSTPTKLHGWNQ